MIEILKELEEKFRKEKLIGQNDYLYMILHSDGTGCIISRNIKNGKIKSNIALDFDNIAAFILKSEQVLGKEISWRDS